MDDMRLKIALISNIIFEPYLTDLVKREFRKDVFIYPIQYEELSEIEYQNQLTKSDMVILWLNFESLFPNVCNEFYSQTVNENIIIQKIITLCSHVYSNLAVHTNAHIYYILFEDYYINLSTALGHCSICDGLIDKINIQIIESLGKSGNISFIDLKHLIAEVGISNAFDNKAKYRWNAPYSKILIQNAVKEMNKQCCIQKGFTKKCLVLDCDNVLWGGILSDDGIENIKLSGSGFGRKYQDFQRFVLSLYYHNVLIAICSKNDLSDVLYIFRNHNEMILKEQNVACFQVNWKDKPYSIKKIAETLNIGLNSIVFVDDSSLEIEAVRATLPEVTAILYDTNTIYSQLSCFNLRSRGDIIDIENRNATYRTNRFRNELKAHFKTYDEYVNALEIKQCIHEASPIEFSRIAELTQRANKCTNGKRYTVTELMNKVKASTYTLYSVTISDKFCDLGLVGAIGIESNMLDLFVLSCRALGMNIEEKMIAHIKKYNIKSIYNISTGKNSTLIKQLSNIFTA